MTLSQQVLSLVGRFLNASELVSNANEPPDEENEMLEKSFKIVKNIVEAIQEGTRI